MKKKISVSPESILRASFNKRPDEMCPELQNAFIGVSKANVEVEELELLEILIKLKKAEIIKHISPSKNGNHPHTVYFQKKTKDDSNGNPLFAWNSRKVGENGKFSSPTIHLRASEVGKNGIPLDYNPKIDDIKFHPEYIKHYFSEWLGFGVLRNYQSIINEPSAFIN